MMSFSMWQKLAAAMIENAVRCGLNGAVAGAGNSGHDEVLSGSRRKTGNMSLFLPAFIHIVSGLHLCSGRFSL
ncbi:hypothetical protein [Agrobacterium sp. LMR679]|uniref:hypothetical protein n=1 Tax=Agrobacterium sp. LMR679 TaxID=3014335 RepID=UPI0022AEF35D|nr:hypothetical protein [Agrobacterium sp. LMR679]MCZ4071633.1 hypothetical protein [Agrobacterium sp. LMR679]